MASDHRRINYDLCTALDRMIANGMSSLAAGQYRTMALALLTLLRGENDRLAPAPPSAEGEAHAAAKGATPVSTYDGRTWLSTGSGAAPASGEAHAPEATAGTARPQPPARCPHCGCGPVEPYVGAPIYGAEFVCDHCSRLVRAASPPSPKDADEASPTVPAAPRAHVEVVTISDRCSVCGSSRVVGGDGTYGACSLVPGPDGKGGCPDPLYDVRREEAAGRAGGPGAPAEGGPRG
jgi:hypothetical protein